jgi:hypothetical protein
MKFEGDLRDGLSDAAFATSSRDDRLQHVIARQLFRVNYEEAERIGALLRATWTDHPSMRH